MVDSSRHSEEHSWYTDSGPTKATTYYVQNNKRGTSLSVEHRMTQRTFASVPRNEGGLFSPHSLGHSDNDAEINNDAEIYNDAKIDNDCYLTQCDECSSKSTIDAIWHFPSIGIIHRWPFMKFMKIRSSTPRKLPTLQYEEFFISCISGIFSSSFSNFLVDKKGLIHHCNQYGVTLIIPEGAIQQSATVQFGACLYSDEFNFGDYVPVTPIVWVYIDQKLIKPAELYLPHHISPDAATKNQIVHLTARDQDFVEKGCFLFTASNDVEIEVEAQLFKTYCHHFCSHCLGVESAIYRKIKKRYTIAIAQNKKDRELQVEFCVFLSQKPCKELVMNQYKGMELDFKPIKLGDDRCISTVFDPDQVEGWVREHVKIYTNKITESDIDYFCVMECDSGKVPETDIDYLKELEKSCNYPPRFRFKFSCNTRAVCKKIIVKVSFVGSDPLLNFDINLELKGSQIPIDAITSSKSETSLEEFPPETDETLLQILLLILNTSEDHFKEKWFIFGWVLKLTMPQLHDIEFTYKSIHQCVREIIFLWRSQNTTASWKLVADALDKAELKTLADQLRHKFEGQPPNATNNSDNGLDTFEKERLTVVDLQSVITALKDGHFDSTKWQILGRALGLHQSTLNVILADKHHELEPSLHKCLEKWLDRSDDVDKNKFGKPSWASLAYTLKSVSVHTAEYICKKYKIDINGDNSEQDQAQQLQANRQGNPLQANEQEDPQLMLNETESGNEEIDHR